MKEVIGILEYIDIREEIINKSRLMSNVSITDFSFNCQLWELAKLRAFITETEIPFPYTWEPSPDTPYKIELTKWIEDKHQAENPYSVFEEWQKGVKIELISNAPMFKIPESYKKLIKFEQESILRERYMKPMYMAEWEDPLDSEEGEG